MITAGLSARPARTRAIDGMPKRLTRWAHSRCLAPNSVTGISLALGACAAGWFSAGTATGNLIGGLVLCACYLAWWTARHLAAAEVPGPGAQQLMRPAVRSTAVAAPATAAPAAGASAASLVRLSAAVSSAAVYAGLALGGRVAGFPGMWQLATAALIVMSLRDMASLCRGETDEDLSAAPPRRRQLTGRATRAALSFSFGGRVALIAVAMPLWGVRVTLVALIGWAIVGVGQAMASPARDSALAPVLADPAGLTAPPDHAASAAAFDVAYAAPADVVAAAATVPFAAAVPMTGISAPAAVTSSAAMSSAELSSLADTLPGAGAVPAVAASGVMAADEDPVATLQELMEAGPAVDLEPVAPSDPRLLTTVRACRDDGRFALRLGRVVRGQLVPLPPAVAGLAATALLGWLGMKNLPGLLLLTPLIVMLLAAFGSAHPHDRGLDWLTPAVLLGGQLLYTTAVGFSFGVPAPITFTLCALIGVHCASLAGGAGGAGLAGGASGDGHDAGQRAGTGLGWEGRMLTVGVGAMAGVPAVAFVILAAYLAVSTSSRILPRYVPLPRS